MTAVLPHLPRLSRKALRRFLATAVDVLTPDQPEVTEQRRHARRYLAFSHYAGMTHIRADLPDVDGAAVQAAIRALAESLRVDGDGLTPGQRHADALMTLINAAAAHGDLPASMNGLPVAASVTISLTEAERLTTRHHHHDNDRDNDGEGTRDPVLLTGSDVTLGDAAARFALCTGTWTGILTSQGPESSTAPGSTGLSGIAARLAGTRIQPLALGRTTRLATPAQRTALALRDDGCVIPGCGRPPSECQTHHVTDWAHGGRTDLDSLASLCWVHHRQVDLHKWRLTRNPDPHGPHWTVTPIRRHAWRKRRAG